MRFRAAPPGPLRRIRISGSQPCWSALLLTAASAFAGLAPTVRAGRAEDIAEIHVAALGGPDRIVELHAYRSVGRLTVGDTTALLTVTAARPNKLRVDTTYPDRTTIAVFDGTNAWQRQDDRPVQKLVGPAAEGLADAADFDDPLVAPAQSGCTVEFAGETVMDGIAVFRLLVTRRLTKTYFLAVDEQTYFILGRVDGGGGAKTLTRYSDYRPVAGVLLPHRVSVEQAGQPPRVAAFDRIEANPTLSPDVFRLK